ncbi:MAG: sensor histidine kinase [Candidatus Sumerlaeaceae bacterium]
MRGDKVLLLTPIGRDSQLICDVLASEGMNPCAFRTIEDLCAEMHSAAGTGILALEALTRQALQYLTDALKQQPSWSDFPLILMVGGANATRSETYISDALRPLGHVTLLERPVRKATLITAVRAALRSRMRQYDVRDNLEELKRAEREIRLTNEQMEMARNEALHASRIKSQFLANMSHELRTPLNAILGFAEMMGEEPVVAQNRELLADVHNIVAAGRHLLELISDILDLSKIEAGQMRVVREPFSVNDLVDGVSRTMAPLVKRNSNVFHVRKDGELGTAVTDEVKLRQSLLNLLSNASKFTEHGQITLAAKRRAIGKQEWLEFEVRDTGIGIAHEDLDSLGTDFLQLDSAHTKRHGGAGLGLSLTRRFCQMMGGQLLVESEPGRGSMFTVQIPAIRPAQARAVIASK